jgi:6-phosphogluconolactonase
VRRLGRFCVCVLLLWNSAGCGGGSSSTTLPPTLPPANTPAELLYASGTDTVTSYSIDSSTGALTEVSSVPGADGGTDLASTPSGSYMYAIDQPIVGIDAFSVSKTGSLSAIAGSPFPFPELNPFLFSGIAIDSAGKFLYSADAGVNSVTGFTIDGTTGALNPIPGGVVSTDTEPRAMALDPSSKFLFVTNETGGSISAFTLDSTTGALTAVPGSPFPIDPNDNNTQPASIAVHTSGKFVYTALFNANGVAAFSVDSTTGALTSIAGSPFATGSNQITQTNWIAIHPSGKFLYTMNLVEASVVAFTIDSTTGALSPTAGSPFTSPPGPFGPVGVQGPIVIDLTGSFLYVACANANITAFRINQNTGALKPLAGSPLTVPVPATGLAVGPVP